MWHFDSIHKGHVKRVERAPPPKKECAKAKGIVSRPDRAAQREADGGVDSARPRRYNHSVIFGMTRQEVERVQATSSIVSEGRTVTDAARSTAQTAAGLAIALAFLITISATSRARAEASSNYFGSGTARVTDDGMTIDRFDRTRFPDFARESLARYFKLGGPVEVRTRASSAPRVEDIELEGPSRCLATEISRAGWQKLRFEFEYQRDPDFEARTSRPRFEFLLRLVSGFVADFPQDHPPPAERYRQIAPSDLTDIASKLAGFMRGELAKACFDRPGLRYCPAPAAEPCR
jgi:hypothetical protein